MEDKLIDADEGRMKDNIVMPKLRGLTVDDLRDLDHTAYETCLGPVAVSSSVMPEPLVDDKCFRVFMDALITYVEYPNPTQAGWVKSLQRMYNISVYMTDYPEKFSVRVSISLQWGMWNVNQWDEMVPYDVADIIKKAVDYL